MNNIIQVGLDDGHYAQKLSYVKNGKVETGMVLSRVAHGHIHSAALNGNTNEANMYEVDGNQYTVIDSINSLSHDVIDLRSIEYPTSDVNLILVMHTLVKAGFTKKDHVNIVTGLPFKEYYTASGKKNEKLIADKTRNLFREIKCMDKNVTFPKIVSHNVMAEGAGAFLSLRIDMDGNLVDDIAIAVNDAPIAIVDIGGKTTDIVTFMQGGQEMLLDMSNTVQKGALELFDHIASEVKEKLKVNNVLPEKIDKALISGKYTAYGVEHDIAPIIYEQKMLFAKQLQNEIRKTLKNAENIGMVVFLGGGSQLIKKELKQLYGAQSYFPIEPQHANSNGFLKGAIYLFNNEE